MTEVAVFLDRDGTLIRDPGYLRDPSRVELLPGVPDAIRKVNGAGLRAIVVTNQSGIARGLVTEDQYLAVQTRLDEMLAARGARLDAHYHCPHLPEISGPCDCRKPGTLLYRLAAERFGINLSRSWWVGDRLRDVEPAEALEGRGILISVTPSDETGREAAKRGHLIAASLPEAVDGFILPRCQ